MIKVQLAVGQVWKDRAGRKVRLEKAGDAPHGATHPFRGVENRRTYRADGRFVFGDAETEHDLIALVQ